VAVQVADLIQDSHSHLIRAKNRQYIIVPEFSPIRQVLSGLTSQQFSVWASKRRVRALWARTLRFKAWKQPAKGGLLSGWMPKWEVL